MTLLHKTIKLQPTDTCLDVVVCENREVVNEYLRMVYAAIDPGFTFTGISPHSRAEFIRGYPAHEFRMAIWVPSIDMTPENINNVVHETRHLMQRWSEQYGFEHGVDNGIEWQAYFHAWIAEQVFIMDGYLEIESYKENTETLNENT